MDSYPFPMYSGIFEPKHYKRIGTALWFFSWCINATTSEVVEEGVTWGNIHDRKPMKLSELAEPFGVDEKTVRRWLKTLEHHEYIRTIRAPYGVIISLKNSKKLSKKRSDINVHSDERDRTDMSTLTDNNVHSLPDRSDINVHSNKDFKELTITTTADGEFENILQAYCQIHGKIDTQISSKDIILMQEMIALGVPSPLIIQVMTELYRVRGKRISTFAYYREAILEAWETKKAITAGVPVPGGVPSPTVALGSSGKQREIDRLRQFAKEERQRGSG